MIGNLMWIITAAAVVGVVANIYKKPWCFAIWMCTNASWATYDFSIEAHAQEGSLFVVYFGLAAWGFIKWTAKK